MTVLVRPVTSAATPPMVKVAPVWKPTPDSWMIVAVSVAPTSGDTALTLTLGGGGAEGVGADGNLSQAAVNAATASTPPARVRAK